MQFIVKLSTCSQLLCVQKSAAKYGRTLALCSARMSNLEKLFPKREEFQTRHIGPREHEQLEMLQTIGFKVKSNSKFSYSVKDGFVFRS